LHLSGSLKFDGSFGLSAFFGKESYAFWPRIAVKEKVYLSGGGVWSKNILGPHLDTMVTMEDRYEFHLHL
jgi:hypothetical protein